MITLKKWMEEHIDELSQKSKELVRPYLDVEEIISEEVICPRWFDWWQIAVTQSLEDSEKLDINTIYDDGMTEQFMKFASLKTAEQLGWLVQPDYMKLCDWNPISVIEELMHRLSSFETLDEASIEEHDAWVDRNILLRKE